MQIKLYHDSGYPSDENILHCCHNLHEKICPLNIHGSASYNLEIDHTRISYQNRINLRKK